MYCLLLYLVFFVVKQILMWGFIFLNGIHKYELERRVATEMTFWTSWSVLVYYVHRWDTNISYHCRIPNPYRYTSHRYDPSVRVYVCTVNRTRIYLLCTCMSYCYVTLCTFTIYIENTIQILLLTSACTFYCTYLVLRWIGADMFLD